MSVSSYRILGVMSGTSVDGIDFAYAEFTHDKSWKFKIHAAETVPYSEEWETELKEGINLEKDKLEDLNKRYTQLLGSEIKAFIERNKITDLDGVASHGHTILHQPEKGFTLQIGNLPAISTLCGERVICDFRVQDVELGGQGAPLVPVGDQELFKDYDFCVNLGGFANVSFEKEQKRLAFDICPVNIVLNRYAEKLGKKYDKSGEIAATSENNKELLYALNKLDFYRQSYPKSLGLEWVLSDVLPLIEEFKLAPEVVIATFTEHAAFQISIALGKALKKEAPSILITGGGAYNTHLINRIKALSKMEVEVPSPELVEYKEALVFGLMGALRLKNEINVLASVTGAKKDHSSGVIFTS